MPNINKYPALAWAILLFLSAFLIFPDSYANCISVPDSLPEKELPEVVVKYKKQKYSKHHNPAVDLMERVRRSQELGNPVNMPHYSFDTYEKITLGLANVRLRPEESDARRKEFEQYTDTSELMGYPIFPVSFREKASSKLFKGGPRTEKSIVTGLRRAGIEQSFNQENIQTIIDDILRPIDIYSNDISLMQQRFVSPLSRIGADYYMYFITDTVTIDGMRCVELTFAPHNPESFSFNGKIYVKADDSDSTAFVKKVSMRTPSSLNLNYLDVMRIEQVFEQDSLGNRHLISDDMAAELRIMPGTPGVYASRQQRNYGFAYDPDDFYYSYIDHEGAAITLPEATSRDPEFWHRVATAEETYRHEATLSLTDRLRKRTFFRVAEQILLILVNGYVATGKNSKFDFGPVNTLFSYNSIEGCRFRLGGMTTANLSPHWFVRGYLAYGTRDRKFKYYAELEYSFPKKEYHSREFPMHSLRLTHRYDLDFIGQHYLFTNSDNVFLSWKRCPSIQATYRRLTQLDYFLERRSGFSLTLSLRHEQQYATPWLPFVTGTGYVRNHYNQAVVRAELRYAPGETFCQAASVRMPVNMDAPIVILAHEYGAKGFMGATFTTNKTELSAAKRLWFSAFGYADLMVKGAILWSKVWYPALLWQNANLTYTIQQETYPLLNPMEFALDRFISWDATYWGNGVLFNRIPLIKKLKMREVVSFRGFWGTLTKKNNPAIDKSLPVFPADAHVGLMGNKPYMEVSVGLDNILTFIRLDYVWRITYRDTPGVDRSGLRFALHFSF